MWAAMVNGPRKREKQALPVAVNGRASGQLLHPATLSLSPAGAEGPSGSQMSLLFFPSLCIVF